MSASMAAFSFARRLLAETQLSSTERASTSTEANEGQATEGNATEHVVEEHLVEHVVHAEHTNKYYVALLFFFTMITCGALCKTMLVGTKVPYTVALLFMGLLFGVLNSTLDFGLLGKSISQWETIDPHLLLFGFLPGLLFESAFSMDWHTFKKCLSQVIILATVGVLIGQGLVAGFCYYVFPYDWDWKFSLLIGAILAATDPVAVVALLKELGASKKLGTIIEGESLMNDGTAIVMFLLFLDLAKGGTKTTGEVIVFFIQVPFAGVAIGLAAGIMTLLCIRSVYNDAAVTISLTLTACYLAFFVAEEVADSSGVLAVVTLGVFLGALGKPYFQVRKEVEETMHHFWFMVSFGANTIIFILAGVIIGRLVSDNVDYLGWADVGWVILFYIFINLARGLTVLMLFPALSRLGYGLDAQFATVMVWGGLRGAVGLALGMQVALSEEFPAKDRALVIFHLGGIVILTLLVNGSTTGALLGALGLNAGSANRAKVMGQLKHDMSELVMSSYLEMFCDDTLGGASYDLVKQYVSSMRPDKKAIAEVPQSPKGPRGKKLIRMMTRKFSDPSVGDKAVEKLAGVSNREKDQQKVVADYRIRLLSAVKNEYVALLETGHSDTAIQFELNNSVDVALDGAYGPLCDWEVLSKDFRKEDTMVSATIRYLPIPSTWKATLASRYEFLVSGLNLQAAVGFVTAHRMASRHLQEHYKSDLALKVLAESYEECILAHEYIREIKAALPEVASTIKTVEVTRSLLYKQLDFVHHTAHSGGLEESEISQLYEGVERDLKNFLAHPPLTERPQKDEILNGLPLIKLLQQTDDVLCQAVKSSAKMVTFSSGQDLIKKKSTEDTVLLIGRGVVSYTINVDNTGTWTTRDDHTVIPVEVRVGCRSHPCGWVAGLDKVLFPSNQLELGSTASSMVVGFVLDGKLVRKLMATPNRPERLILMQAAAGLLLETVLMCDVDLNINQQLLESVAEGNLVDLPDKELDVSQEKDLLILLQGSVFCNCMGQIQAPAILTHLLQKERSALTHLMKTLTLTHDGKVRPNRDSFDNTLPKDGNHSGNDLATMMKQLQVTEPGCFLRVHVPSSALRVTNSMHKAASAPAVAPHPLVIPGAHLKSLVENPVFEMTKIQSLNDMQSDAVPITVRDNDGTKTIRKGRFQIDTEEDDFHVEKAEEKANIAANTIRTMKSNSLNSRDAHNLKKSSNDMHAADPLSVSALQASYKPATLTAAQMRSMLNSTQRKQRSSWAPLENIQDIPDAIAIAAEEGVNLRSPGTSATALSHSRSIRNSPAGTLNAQSIHEARKSLGARPGLAL